MRDALKLDLSHCRMLRAVGIGFCVANDHHRTPAEHRHVSARQNEYIWENSLSVLLNIMPNLLSRVYLHISFTTYEEWETPSEFFQILCELNWAFLDRVLDRHPNLEVLEIRFLERTPWIAAARRMIEEKLSRKVLQLTRFRLSPTFEYDKY